MNDIRDIALAPSGERKIAWVRRNMPVLRGIEADFEREKPFDGMKVALSVHLEAKTAYLCRVLAAGGAQMYVTGSNPLSTQDDVAAALAAGGMEVHAVHGATAEEYARHLDAVLSVGPNIIIDDGGELVELMRTKFKALLPGVIGGCEETTTGITRLKKLARDGILPFTMMMVNDADCKHMFDNRYGTGQSVWDGIMRTTNLIVAGKYVVVSGYGWCGKGVAMRAAGRTGDTGRTGDDTEGSGKLSWNLPVLYFEAGKKDHAAAEKGDQPAYLTLHSGRIHDTIEITERNCSPGCE